MAKVMNSVSYQLDIINKMFALYGVIPGYDPTRENEIIHLDYTLDSLQDELRDIVNEYNIHLIGLIEGDATEGVAALEEVLANIDIEGKLMNLFLKIKSCISKDKAEYYTSEFGKYRIGILLVNDVTKCTDPNCGGEMEKRNGGTSSQCKECGASVNNNISDSVDTFSVYKRKGPQNENTATIKKIFNEIMGTSTLNIPPDDLARIQMAIRTNGYRLITSMNADDVRQIFKRHGLTKYNEKVPHILRKYTGCMLMIYTDLEIQIISDIFQRANIVFANYIKGVSRKNKLGKFYMIYKISCAVIKDPTRIAMLTKIIHFPELGTLARYDKTWEMMCKHDLGIDYVPTPHSVVS